MFVHCTGISANSIVDSPPAILNAQVTWIRVSTAAGVPKQEHYKYVKRGKQTRVASAFTEVTIVCLLARGTLQMDVRKMGQETDSDLSVRHVSFGDVYILGSVIFEQG